MKASTSQLRDVLALEQFQMADLYTLTLTDGSVLRLTSRDTDVTWDGNVYSSAGPFVEREGLSWRRGAEVDALTVRFAADSSHTIGATGIPFLHAVVRGLLDGGVLTLQRAFWDYPDHAVDGVITLFTGRVGDISGNGAQVECEVNSYLELLSQKMPRNTYSPGCRHTLFDPACGLTRASWGSAGTVAAGSSRTHIHVSGISDANDYHSMGTIVFEDGALEGQKRFIKHWYNNVVYMVLELWEMPEVGDEITLYPGCDKIRATCKDKFNNEANFGGFPYVPDPEKAV